MALNTTDGDGAKKMCSNLGLYVIFLYFFFLLLIFHYFTTIQKAVRQMKYCTLQLQESIETMDSQAFLGTGGFDLGGA